MITGRVCAVSARSHGLVQRPVLPVNRVQVSCLTSNQNVVHTTTMFYTRPLELETWLRQYRHRRCQHPVTKHYPEHFTTTQVYVNVPTTHQPSRKTVSTQKVHCTSPPFQITLPCRQFRPEAPSRPKFSLSFESLTAPQQLICIQMSDCDNAVRAACSNRAVLMEIPALGSS